MPSTYTLNNGIELIATGEQSGTWGDTTNTNMSLLDTALDGQVTVTLASAGTSGSPNTLPISDGAASDGRNRLVIFNDGADLGATAYVQLTPNDAEKIVYIRNALSGSRSIIVFQGTYNASNDYEIPAGTTAVIFFNGGGTGAVAANVFNNAHFDALNIVGAAAVGTTLTVGTSLNIASSTTVDGVLDEDNMASDSATKLATQQSIKAYVDSQVGTVDTWAEVLANGNTTGATDAVVTAGQKLTTNTIDETTADSGVTIDSVLLKDGGATLTDDLVVNTNNLFVDTSASKTMFNTTYNADSGVVTIRGTYGANNASDYRGNNALALTGADPGTTAAGSGINLAFVPVTNRGSTAVISGENTGTNKEGGAQLRFSIGAGAFPTTQREMLLLNYDSGAIFNEGSADLDFRIESDSNTHALFVDAGNSRVGFMTSAPDRPVHLKSAGNRNYIKAETTGTTDSEEAGFDVKAGSNNYLVGALGGTDNRFFIYDLANALDKFTIKQGDIIINDSGVDGDFRVESDTNANALYVDAGNSRVGINTTPSYTVHALSAQADAFLFSSSHATTTNLYINNTNATTNNTANLYFSPANAVAGAYIEAKALEDFSVIANRSASLDFVTRQDGNWHSRLNLSDTATIFNENGRDTDFRVESDSNANMLVVDAGNNAVGIGYSGSTNTLGVAGTGNASFSSAKGIVLDYQTSSTSNVLPIGFSWSNSTSNQNPLWGMGFVPENYSSGTGGISFYTGNTKRMNILSSGAVELTGSSLSFTIADGVNINAAESLVVNIDSDDNDSGRVFQTQTGAGLVMMTNSETSGSIFNEGGDSTMDFRVESDANANMIFADAGNSQVNINNNVAKVHWSSNALMDLNIAGAKNYPGMSVMAYSATSNAGGMVILGRSRSATAGTLSTTLTGDQHGYLLFEGVNGNNTLVGSSYIESYQPSGTSATTVPGRLRFYTATQTALPALNFQIDSTAVVSNENGADQDFRVESDSNANMLFVDAGNNAVGIGGTPLSTSPLTVVGQYEETAGDGYDYNIALFPDTSLSIAQGKGTGILFMSEDSGSSARHAAAIQSERNSTTAANYTNNLTFKTRENGQDMRDVFTLYGGGGAKLLGASAPNLNFLPDGAVGNADISFNGTDFIIVSNSSSADLKLKTNSTERVRWEATNGVTFNEDSHNYDFRVESDDNANMLLVDAGGNFVGVNQTSSDYLSVLALSNRTSGNALSIGSESAITGSAEYAQFAEGTFVADTVSSGNTLSIPIQSQGSKWERYTIEFMFASGEYNESSNATAGTCKVRFASLTSLSGVTALETTGNVSGVTSSGMNLQITFTSAFTAGLSNYEGVLVYYKILGSRVRYVQFWNATLN